MINNKVAWTGDCLQIQNVFFNEIITGHERYTDSKHQHHHLFSVFLTSCTNALNHPYLEVNTVFN